MKKPKKPIYEDIKWTPAAGASSDKWKPIDTAPLDSLIVAKDDDGRIMLAKWYPTRFDGKVVGGFWNTPGVDAPFTPTLWLISLG